LECARIASDRVLILTDGQFSKEGTYDELLKSKDKNVASYFNIS